MHPEYLTAAMVYNIIRKFAVKKTDAKYVVHNNRKQLFVCIVFCTKIEYN